MTLTVAGLVAVCAATCADDARVAVSVTTGVLTGLVVKCDGSPISGVMVKVQGTGLGGFTDGDGRFFFTTAPPGAQTLQLQLVGYSTTIVSVVVPATGVGDAGRLAMGCDQVRLSRSSPTLAAAESFETVFVVDAKVASGDCRSDLVSGDGPHTYALRLFMENLVPGGSCSSEVAAFSMNQAPFFKAAPTAWTTSQGDALAGSLQQRLHVPLHFWIAVEPAAVSVATGKATTAFLKAQQIFDGSRVGVHFDWNVGTATAGIETIGSDCDGAITAGLQASSWYVKNEINVYYVAEAFTPTSSGLASSWGVSCGADKNIIFISYLHADETTLAHELGHAFGLRGKRGHTNWTLRTDFSDSICTTDEDPTKAGCQPPCPSPLGADAQPTVPGCQKFTPANVMYDGVTGRTEFTVGQVYQMVLLDSSELHLDGYWTGTTKSTCGTNPWDDNPCPVLWLNP